MNYFLTDHLGSVRVVVDGSGVVKERNDYYPFGARHVRADYPQNDNRLKYNGKEEQVTGDLDYLDYGARMYDGELGRWFGMDPLAENYLSQSPYHFCGNNPIIFVDPNGMDYWSTNDPGLIAQFLNSIQGGSSTHDFFGWNHTTDAEFTGNLSYNDETGKYYTFFTEIREINKKEELYVISKSFHANLMPIVEFIPYQGAFVRESLSGFWQNLGYYTGVGGYDTYPGIGGGHWNVSREGRLTGGSVIRGMAPSVGMGGVGQVRSTVQKTIFLKQFAQNPQSPRWMKQWLSAGKIPPGYNVEHIKPLSVGGIDLPSNMRLNLILNHRLIHKYYHPWR